MRKLCANYARTMYHQLRRLLTSTACHSLPLWWGHTFFLCCFLFFFLGNTSLWSFLVVSLSQSESFFFLELLLLLCTMWPELLLLVMLMLSSSQLLLLVLMLLLLPACADSTAGESFWKAEKRSATCIGILTWIDDTDSSLFDFILTLQLCYISDC